MPAKMESRLCLAARKVWKEFRGSHNCDENLEDAILDLRRAERDYEIQTSEERAALVHIVNVADGFGSPAFKADDMSKLDEAIDRARKILETSDLIVVQK